MNSIITLLFLLVSTVTGQSTCVSTGITDQAIDEAIAAATAMGQAAAESAEVALRTGVRNIRAADGTWTTVTTTADEARAAVTSIRAGIVGAVPETLSIPNFCVVQNIGGVDIYMQGDAIVHPLTSPPTVDGSLTILNTFQLGTYLQVSHGSVKVEGLALARPLHLDTFTLSGQFCAGSAVNCGASPRSNTRTISGTVTLAHTAADDSATANLPETTLGAVGYLLIDAAQDTATADRFVTFLGAAAGLGIRDTSFVVTRNRQATCTETAETPVSADTAACATVTSLDDSTACDAVMTAADPSTGACTYTEAGKIKPEILPFTPIVPTLTAAQETACELQNFVGMTCGVIIIRYFANDGASCSLVTNPSTDANVGDEKTFACNDGTARTVRNELSLTWGGAQTSGFIQKAGKLFDIAGLFHVLDPRIEFSTSTNGNTVVVSGDFCIGSVSDCDYGHRVVAHSTQGTMTLTHTPNKDTIVGNIESLTVGGFAYPLIAKVLETSHATTFLEFLGPLQDCSIANAEFGLIRENGKMRPIISGTPGCPRVPTGPEDLDVCDISHFQPLMCALKHIQVDETATASDGTRMRIIAESPDTSADVSAATIMVEVNRGDVTISLTWEKNNGGGSVTGQVSINGEFIDVGYLHVNDAHVSVTRSPRVGGDAVYDATVDGNFCLGSDTACAAGTNDEDNSIRGSLVITHSGGTDTAVGQADYVSVGSFISSQLSRHQSTRDTVMNTFSTAVKKFGIEDASIAIRRSASTYGLELMGTPAFTHGDPPTCPTDGGDPATQEATNGKLVDCTLADCGDHCPSLSFKTEVSGIGTESHSIGVEVGINLPPVTWGSHQLEDELGRGPGLFVGASAAFPRGPPTIKAGIRVSFKVKDEDRICPSDRPKCNDVYFKGELSTGLAGISGSVMMYGTWTQMFGLNFLHASDLKFGLTILPVWPPAPKAITLGGEICIGSASACYGSPVAPAVACITGSESSCAQFLPEPEHESSEPTIVQLSGPVPADTFCIKTAAERTFEIAAIMGLNYQQPDQCHTLQVVPASGGDCAETLAQRTQLRCERETTTIGRTECSITDLQRTVKYCRTRTRTSTHHAATPGVVVSPAANNRPVRISGQSITVVDSWGVGQTIWNDRSAYKFRNLARTVHTDLVANEGVHLGGGYGWTNARCKAECDSNSNCNSFSSCNPYARYRKGCWLKKAPNAADGTWQTTMTNALAGIGLSTNQMHRNRRCSTFWKVDTPPEDALTTENYHYLIKMSVSSRNVDTTIRFPKRSKVVVINTKPLSTGYSYANNGWTSCNYNYEAEILAWYGDENQDSCWTRDTTSDDGEDVFFPGDINNKQAIFAKLLPTPGVAARTVYGPWRDSSDEAVCQQPYSTTPQNVEGHRFVSRSEVTPCAAADRTIITASTTRSDSFICPATEFSHTAAVGFSRAVVSNTAGSTVRVVVVGTVVSDCRTFHPIVPEATVPVIQPCPETGWVETRYPWTSATTPSVDSWVTIARPCISDDDQSLCTVEISPARSITQDCTAYCNPDPNQRLRTIPAVKTLVDDSPANGATYIFVPGDLNCKTFNSDRTACETYNKVEVETVAARTETIPCQQAPIACAASRTMPRMCLPAASPTATPDPTAANLAAANAAATQHETARVARQQAERTAMLAENPACAGTGNFPCGHFIKARAHLVIDTTNPSANFAILYISEVTVERILYILYETAPSTFGHLNPDPSSNSMASTLPSSILGSGLLPLQESGCPTVGLDPGSHPDCFARFSYSPTKAQTIVRSAGDALVVPHGIAFAARLNLLGWEVKADIQISPTRFKIHGECDPILLGRLAGQNVIELTRSSTDRTLGPVIKLDIEAGAVQVELHAYFGVPLLQLSAEAHVFITDTRMVCHVQANIFSLFCAEVQFDMGHPDVNILPMNFYVQASTNAQVCAPNSQSLKQNLIMGAIDLIRQVFEGVDDIFEKIAEYTDKIAGICTFLFPNNADLQGICEEVRESDLGKAAVALFEKVFDWLRGKVAQAQSFVFAELGIGESPPTTVCTPEQMNDPPDERTCTDPPTYLPPTGTCAAAAGATNANCAAHTTRPDCLEASTPDHLCEFTMAIPEDTSSWFSLTNADMTGSISDDSPPVATLAASIHVTFLGKPYSAVLPTTNLNEVVERLVTSLVESVKNSIKEVVNSVTAFFTETMNKIRHMWNRLRSALEPAALQRYGEQAMIRVRAATGGDNRRAFTLSVSGNGKHMWAFNDQGGILYRAGKQGTWTDVLGAESATWGHSNTNSITTDYDGSNVWLVTHGGHVHHRPGFLCPTDDDRNRQCSWSAYKEPGSGDCATGHCLLNEDMRFGLVSGNGEKLFTIEDSSALGLHQLEAYGGDVYKCNVRHILHDAVCTWDEGNTYPLTDGSFRGATQLATNYDGSTLWTRSRNGDIYTRTCSPACRAWELVPDKTYDDWGNFLELSNAKQKKTSTPLLKISNKLNKLKKPVTVALLERKMFDQRHKYPPPSAETAAKRQLSIGKKQDQEHVPLDSIIVPRNAANKFIGGGGGLRSNNNRIDSIKQVSFLDALSKATSSMEMKGGCHEESSTRQCATGLVCDEDEHCLSGNCDEWYNKGSGSNGENTAGNCGSGYVFNNICGVCTARRGELLPGESCSMDWECKKIIASSANEYGVCIGGTSTGQYGQGHCSDGQPGANCNNNRDCVAIHVGERLVDGRCDDDLYIFGGHDTDKCLFAPASREGGESCTLNDECKHGGCDGNLGGNLRDDDWGTGTCPFAGQSRLGGESCVEDNECKWGNCEDGVCPDGLPGSPCGENSHCQTELCDDSIGGSDTCLYPRRSRRNGQTCTKDKECGTPEQTDGIFGDTCVAGCCDGICKGGMKYVSGNNLPNGGTILYGVDSVGEVFYRESGDTAWSQLEPHTYTSVNEHWKHPHRTYEMDQVIASNSPPVDDNQELWGVTVQGLIYYKTDRTTPWVPYEQAPICTCEGGEVPIGSHCVALPEWMSEGGAHPEWHGSLSGRYFVVGESCVPNSCNEAYTWEPSSASTSQKEKGRCALNLAKLPTIPSRSRAGGVLQDHVLTDWGVDTPAWNDRQHKLHTLNGMTKPHYDYMIQTSVQHLGDPFTIHLPAASTVVVLQEAGSTRTSGWTVCNDEITNNIDGFGMEVMNVCQKKQVVAGQDVTIPASTSKRVVFVKVTTSPCNPTQVLHSNKATSNSIAGFGDDEVSVTCDTGYAPSGVLRCQNGVAWVGTFGLCITCDNGFMRDSNGNCQRPQPCTPSGGPSRGFSHSNKESEGSITGNWGQSVTATCLTGYNSANGGSRQFTAHCGTDGTFTPPPIGFCDECATNYRRSGTTCTMVDPLPVRVRGQNVQIVTSWGTGSSHRVWTDRTYWFNWIDAALSTSHYDYLIKMSVSDRAKGTTIRFPARSRVTVVNQASGNRCPQSTSHENVCPQSEYVQTRLVVDQGAHLGGNYGLTDEDCKLLCDGTAGCNSFASCINQQGCWIKGWSSTQTTRIDALAGINLMDPSHHNIAHRQCKTFWKIPVSSTTPQATECSTYYQAHINVNPAFNENERSCWQFETTATDQELYFPGDINNKQAIWVKVL